MSDISGFRARFNFMESDCPYIVFQKSDRDTDDFLDIYICYNLRFQPECVLFVTRDSSSVFFSFVEAEHKQSLNKITSDHKELLTLLLRAIKNCELRLERAYTDGNFVDFLLDRDSTAILYLIESAAKILGLVLRENDELDIK